MNLFIKLISAFLATIFGIVLIPILFVFAILLSFYISVDIIKKYLELCDEIIFGNISDEGVTNNIYESQEND